MYVYIYRAYSNDSATVRNLCEACLFSDASTQYRFYGNSVVTAGEVEFYLSLFCEFLSL